MSYNVSTLLLLTILIAVLVAVWSATAELGLLLTIMVLPPLIRTAMVLRLRQQRFPGETQGMSQKAMLFVTSFFVTLSCVVTTLFCSVAAAISSGLFVKLVLGEGDFAIVVAMFIASLAGIGTAVVLIILSTHWVIFRWERDTRVTSLSVGYDSANQQ